MAHKKRTKLLTFWLIGLAFMLACGFSSTAPTPTPTSAGGLIVPPPASAPLCEGLSGELEMQVLVGPAEVVGLEPVAVGAIPFTVVPQADGHILQGGGSISYQDTLTKDWGTYTVSFALEGTVSGTCTSSENSGTLNVSITMSGEQLVEVRSEGFQGDYPWSGTHEFNLSFPITAGATAEGEGWSFVLHLNQ